ASPRPSHTPARPAVALSTQTPMAAVAPPTRTSPPTVTPLPTEIPTRVPTVRPTVTPGRRPAGPGGAYYEDEQGNPMSTPTP
ncbi:MAG: peptidoglycan-binding protein, partial [Acidobacteriota bacterium]